MIYMKKAVNGPDGIKERIPKAFKSKLPLVAGLREPGTGYWKHETENSLKEVA